ncbi:hypothetical protein ACET3Z_004916 [Daucus carota]
MEFQRESSNLEEPHEESDEGSSVDDEGSRSGSPRRRRNAGASSSQGPSEGKPKSQGPKRGCYVCKGPHVMAKRPKLGSLSAMLQRGEDELRRLSTLERVDAPKEEPRVTYLGSLRLVEEDQVEERRKAKGAKHGEKGNTTKESPKSPRGNGAKDKGRVSPSNTWGKAGLVVRKVGRQVLDASTVSLERVETLNP